jgi:transposase
MSPTSTEFSSLIAENALLKGQIYQLTETSEATIRQLTETFETKIRLMQRQIDELLKRVYGRSREKFQPDQLLMQEMLLELEKNTPPAETNPSVEVVVKGHARHKHGRSPLPEHLPRVEHVQDISDDQKVCGCGKTMKHIGNAVTERIDYQPSSLFVNAYIRLKYACSDNACDCGGVRQASAPEGPIDRCEADAGMLAKVIVDKFEHHMPLYRQEQILERSGVAISRQTMADWMKGCAGALTPLYEFMLREILAHDLVLNDDTTVDMRDGPEPGIRQARFWATVGGKDLKYTLYNFTLGRGADGPEKFFKDYKGYFVSDAYAGYNGLFKPPKEDIPANIINAACWTYARRYFVKAQDTAPRAGMEILSMIALLYKIEAEIKHLPPDEKKAIRQKKSKIIIDSKIKPWLEAGLTAHLPQSEMRKAIGYSLGIWKELQTYLLDGCIPIDNNLAENAIRPIALGRKNWLFVGSETGGHTAAILMTFCATCRKNKINTWAYLKDVLQRINAHPVKRLHELLPDQWQADQKKV